MNLSRLAYETRHRPAYPFLSQGLPSTLSCFASRSSSPSSTFCFSPASQKLPGNSLYVRSSNRSACVLSKLPKDPDITLRAPHSMVPRKLVGVEGGGVTDCSCKFDRSDCGDADVVSVVCTPSIRCIRAGNGLMGRLKLPGILVIVPPGCAIVFERDLYSRGAAGKSAS